MTVVVQRTLAAERDDLRAALATSGWPSGPESGDWVEREARLADVEHALLRLAEGSYGLCECCLHPIPAEWLTADLTARFCGPHERAWRRRQRESAARVARVPRAAS